MITMIITITVVIITAISDNIGNNNDYNDIIIITKTITDASPHHPVVCPKKEILGQHTRPEERYQQ